MEENAYSSFPERYMYSVGQTEFPQMFMEESTVDKLPLIIGKVSHDGHKNHRKYAA